MFLYFRLLYVRNGDFESGGPIGSITQIMYIPLDDKLAEEINRRINDDNVFSLAGLSLSNNIQTTTSPSETPTNVSTTTPINTNCSTTEETFITSTTGFAIAGAAVACLALITCAIIACVYLRVKQRAHNRKVKRFVYYLLLKSLYYT